MLPCEGIAFAMPAPWSGLALVKIPTEKGCVQSKRRRRSICSTYFLSMRAIRVGTEKEEEEEEVEDPYRR